VFRAPVARAGLEEREADISPERDHLGVAPEARSLPVRPPVGRVRLGYHRAVARAVVAAQRPGLGHGVGPARAGPVHQRERAVLGQDRVKDLGQQGAVGPLARAGHDYPVAAHCWPSSTGTTAQTYAITGPEWSGTLPPGVKQYKSSTNLVWILGRIYCTGTPEDYKAVHELQDQCKLVPLSAYGKSYTAPEGKVDPSLDMKTAVRDQVNRMDAKQYFSLLAQLMKTNPPPAADAPALARFAKIGLVPGKDFDASKLNADFVTRIPQIAFDRTMLQFKINSEVKHTNGWNVITKTGIYGTDYLMRALIAAIGLGANRPQDAVYPTSLKDADDKDYEGSNKYVIHFDKGHTPPADGFWSITMYDSGYFFVPNPINRYSISARQNLKANPDGSIDILIQKDTPGADKESNHSAGDVGNQHQVSKPRQPHLHGGVAQVIVANGVLRNEEDRDNADHAQPQVL